MATPTQAPARPKQDKALEEKIKQVRALYADAPEMGKSALERALADQSELAARSQEMAATQSAGRIGARRGKVSELTTILPFANGGAKRLRGLLQLLQGDFRGAEKVGTLHDMRFVFLDNDTKALFATAYDGEWDAYIDDFATKIPDSMDMLFCNFEGWPGIKNPAVKDWIAKRQIAAEAWYVANPDLTVAETRHLERVKSALDEFLDKIGQ